MLYVLLIVNYWVYLLIVTFSQQVDQIVKVCSQRYYLLQQMRKQGLDVGCLQVVLQSIVISKVMYALPAWGGYVSRENISRIDKILHKARRYGFTSTLHCFGLQNNCSLVQYVQTIVCITYYSQIDRCFL